MNSTFRGEMRWGEGASQEKGQIAEALGVMAPATPGKGGQA